MISPSEGVPGRDVPAVIRDDVTALNRSLGSEVVCNDDSNVIGRRVAAPWAHFKGTGTGNGQGGYGFMLTAIDGPINGCGGSDKFRIKIWVIATEEVVYDNQIDDDDNADPTTILGGGSIVIHKAK